MIGNVASNAAACMHVGDEQARRQERDVRHATEGGVGGLIDVRPETQAHRRQEQDRGQERAEDARPERPPVRRGTGARRRARSPGDGRGDGGHQSISERPVRRRKTSSSDDRRTRTGLRLEPASVGRGDGRLAVVGVEQDTVGQALDALGEAVELAVERLLDARRRSAARSPRGSSTAR